MVSDIWINNIYMAIKHVTMGTMQIFRGKKWISLKFLL